MRYICGKEDNSSILLEETRLNGCDNNINFILKGYTRIKKIKIKYNNFCNNPSLLKIRKDTLLF